MTIDEARVWLQRHADNTPMPGAREVYKTILEALGGENCQDEKMDFETAIRLLRFERSERYPELPGFLKVRDAMEMAINALERTRWIPVEEEKPPEGELILCSDGNVVFQGMLAAGVWVLDNVARGLQPTHWMLLPEPPEVK